MYCYSHVQHLHPSWEMPQSFHRKTIWPRPVSWTIVLFSTSRYPFRVHGCWRLSPKWCLICCLGEEEGVMSLRQECTAILRPDISCVAASVWLALCLMFKALPAIGIKETGRSKDREAKPRFLNLPAALVIHALRPDESLQIADSFMFFLVYFHALRRTKVQFSSYLYMLQYLQSKHY